MSNKKNKNFPKLLAAASLILTGLVLLLFKISAGNLPCGNTLSCKESLKLSVRNNEKGVFDGQEVDPPQINLSDTSTEPKVLGSETATGEKNIYVDLTTQTLKAYQGDTLFMETKISSGKWFPTPIGEYTIWNKLRATLMSGGEGADYYYLPNVPYVMYFYNSEVGKGRGFALHGTYWHNNFGHPMSHGCINLRTIDAQKLYYWTDPVTKENGSALVQDVRGTKVTIYGETL